MPLLLPRSLSARRTSGLQLVVLGVILLIAAAFRMHGLMTWDAGTHQHPDERLMTIVADSVAMPGSIGEYFNTPRSTLNPYARGNNNYAYGQLPLTLTRQLAEWTGNASYASVYLVGRALSTLADLATILFAWLLARRIFGLRVAH